MINELSGLLGLALIFKGRRNEAEAIAMRKSDFDYLLFKA